MPRFAVILHLRGPFKESGGGEVYDGAYTCRFVSAEQPEAAAVLAIENLRADTRFQTFQAGSPDGTPRIEIEEVRSADSSEGRDGTPGWIYYDESSSEEAKTKASKPRASG